MATNITILDLVEVYEEKQPLDWTKCGSISSSFLEGLVELIRDGDVTKNRMFVYESPGGNLMRAYPRFVDGKLRRFDFVLYDP